MNAVVLLSGGLDSYTTAAIARAEGFALYALTVFYGQRHSQELDAARRIASSLAVARHLEIAVDMRAIGGSALTGAGFIPKDRLSGRGIEQQEVPPTYVPARNTILLALALAWAEVVGANDIYIGVNAVDYSGYPDCRPEFIAAFQHLASLATKTGVGGAAFSVHAPLIERSKAQIIRRGLELGLDYGLAHSCYDPLPNGRPCGCCDSCLLRASGFREAGVADPLLTSNTRVDSQVR